jgi:hypothetical protein
MIARSTPATRAETILKHLTSGRTLTQGEAVLLGYGPNIARPIFSLRRAGHDVVTTIKKDILGNSYAEYSLVRRNSRTMNHKAA